MKSESNPGPRPKKPKGEEKESDAVEKFNLHPSERNCASTLKDETGLAETGR